jgi:hypothetical protein
MSTQSAQRTRSASRIDDVDTTYFVDQLIPQNAISLGKAMNSVNNRQTAK